MSNRRSDDVVLETTDLVKHFPITQGIVISERDANYADFDREAFEAELARRSGARA